MQMKKLLFTLLAFISISTYGQNDLKTRTQPIVDEGKRLYKSEMASWYGTDLFLENHPDRTNIGGYFSYTQDDVSKCIFFSKGDKPKVIGTITFDNTYNTKTARVDLAERDFSTIETDLFSIRKLALETINSDTLFKRYVNTQYNIIPLINKDEKKVYVLTGSQQNGVVFLGNDYVLTFDLHNKLTQKKKIHKNLIPIKFEGKEQTAGVAMHSHLPETGEFITATDICTLMLYEKLTKWRFHYVVSKNYVSIWNCLTDELTVMTMEAFKKISKEEENKK
jgi:hypothetical protein